MTLPVLEPHDTAAAAAMLADAAASGTRLVPHGHQTKLDPRAQTSEERGLSSLGLTSGLVHYAGDLVATIPAGCTLREANARLAVERQWLPLDPPVSGLATIGGIVAANASGPRRHRYGSPRDLIIGIEVALTNGTTAHSGGRVVKNVAGYDLARLFCGSQGSLGLITSVTFKLAPLSPASHTVVARFASAQNAAGCALDLASVPSLTPSAIELVAPDARLLVRFETTRRSGEQMAAAAAAILATECTDVEILEDAADTAVWAAHEAQESVMTGVVASISVLPNAVGGAIEDAARIAEESGVRWAATGRAALGVVRLRTEGEAPAQARCAAALRAAITARGGHVQFTGQTLLLPETFDLSGTLGTARAINAAVKQRFDPDGILPSPWSRD